MKVYITRNIPNSGIEMLKEAGFDVRVSSKNGVLTHEELLDELKSFNPDALLCLLTDKIDKEVFDAAPNIKICATYSVGFNHIDIEEAKKRGLVVTHTPGVLTNTVAEYATTLILSLAKRVVEADSFTRAGNYKGWSPTLLLGVELKGKTLGILGAGRIGSAVAQNMYALGMKVVYSDIQENEKLKSMGAAYMTKEEVLKESDVVSVHVPLLESTKHYLGMNEFKMMKNTALLINTSRGPVINESDLSEALRQGEIAGAALDVFENEPEITEGLIDMNNVILTPHIASATKETREKMSSMAAQSIIDFFNGVEPEHKL